MFGKQCCGRRRYAPPHARPYAGPVNTTALEEHAALVALLSVRPGKLGWSDITAQVIETGSAREIWERHVPATLPGIPSDNDAVAQAREQVLGWHREDLAFVTILDDDYPDQLRDVHQAPPILFFRGKLLTADKAVSVVGSRNASDAGLDFAANTARALVAERLTVAAGLASGIDTAAHTAALDSAGRTVAVIGTGIRNTYPAENTMLQATIAQRGLVVSQFWPDAPPQRQNFLMRNATMSGYGLATVVVEAGEQSGARAQARIAVEHGRPVILSSMVVRANEWAQRLIDRPGVHIAGSVDEVIDTIRTITREDAELDEALSTIAVSDG
ncbi:MAG: DNA-processing protein DprA [Actinophytocola sp.]|nr:DNA-processing protein DprA [Actinophytocola sp.]